MKIVDASFTIEDPIDGAEILKKIERAGRVAYKSEGKIAEGSAVKFVTSLIHRGHLSVLEHQSISVRVICSRACANEWVRHRLASYTQLSTRYVCYAKEQFGGVLSFIRPGLDDDKTCDGRLMSVWVNAMEDAERHYLKLISLGAKPEEARGVLPLDLETEVYVTMNLRSWLHFFELRTDKAAHPEIRKLAIGIRDEFRRLIPVVFDEVAKDE